MPTARSKQIDLNVTSYYHCYVRCVRKGYLFGNDENGKNYDHRKEWIVARLKKLCGCFAIQIAAFAVMSNHYHVVLKVEELQALSWSDEEVTERWKAALGSRKFFFPTPEQTTQWRKNLYSISWFMRFMNEYIARLANKEDQVTGRFWEGRFKSQALADEGALLACMAYVDLNPIRAKMANTLESSDFTSIKERLEVYKKEKAAFFPLMSFKTETDITPSIQLNTLPFSLKDYFALVEWTGRQIREDKSGFIAPHLSSIIQLSGLAPKNWINTVTDYGKKSPSVVGSLEKMQTWAKKVKQSWLKGQSLAKVWYLTS